MTKVKLVDAETFIRVVGAGRRGRAYITHGGVYWFRDAEIGDQVWETQYATIPGNSNGKFIVVWVPAESKLFKDCQALFPADKVLALDEDRYADLIYEAYRAEAA